MGRGTDDGSMVLPHGQSLHRVGAAAASCYIKADCQLINSHMRSIQLNSNPFTITQLYILMRIKM
jgi:hypothetical protein